MEDILLSEDAPVFPKTTHGSRVGCQTRRACLPHRHQSPSYYFEISYQRHDCTGLILLLLTDHFSFQRGIISSSSRDKQRKKIWDVCSASWGPLSHLRRRPVLTASPARWFWSRKTPGSPDVLALPFPLRLWLAPLISPSSLHLEPLPY